jgi:hypothetical protein
MERAPIVRIRLTRNYSTYSVGTVIDIEPPALAERLVADGVAVVESQRALFVEQATAEPAAEQAALTPRRGRPPRAISQPEHDG